MAFLKIEILSCHYMWASLTAGFMFLPVAVEALSLIGGSFRWLTKDLCTRIPLAVLFVSLFHLLTGMLAQEVFPTMDPFNYYTYCLLGLFLILFFPIYLFRTLKGYFALMDEAPAEDGTVSDPEVMLDNLQLSLVNVNNHPTSFRGDAGGTQREVEGSGL